jgi:predicted nuclease of predicted toxin-antitoxin system
VKFYLDEDIKPLLAEMLRARGFDCLAAREAGALTRSDSEQLAFATQQNRTIITFNIVDYLHLATTWAAEGREHAGIIVSDQLSPPEVLRRLLRLITQHQGRTLQNQVFWLQNYKDKDAPRP